MKAAFAKLTLLALVAVLGASATASAQCAPTPLASFGPLNPFHGAPNYYVDTTGRALELCLDNNPLLVNQLCLLALPDPGAPVSFPDNFGDENANGSGTDARASIHGDVLHSRPAVVNYNRNTPSDENDIVAYYGSNDAVFRAIKGGFGSGAGEEEGRVGSSAIGRVSRASR